MELFASLMVYILCNAKLTLKKSMNTINTTNTTEKVNATFTIPELMQRLECYDELQRDIICMHIKGYDHGCIAQEHNVSLDFVKHVVKAFLADLL